MVKSVRDPDPEAKTDGLGVAGKDGDKDFEDSRFNERSRDDDYPDRRGRFSSRDNDPRDWEENGPSDPERRRAFREKWAQTYLPNLPKKDGWHRCWVSTSNNTDTPARRLALGYTFVTEQDIEGAGWAPEAGRVKDGSYMDGAVRWREMVAMQCPEELYQEYMREFHYEMPREAVSDIFEPLAELNERGRRQGARVTMTEDLDAIRQMYRRRAPKEFE